MSIIVSLLILGPTARATPVCVAALLPQTIHTMRTTIRRTQLADVDLIYRALNKPTLVDLEMIPAPHEIARPRSSRNEERVNFTIWEKSAVFGQHVIGSIYFDFLVPAAHPHLTFLRPMDRWVGLGFVLAPEYWGLGLASEVIKKSLRVFDREWRPEGYTASVMENNLASRRILEKSGFRILKIYGDVLLYGRTRDRLDFVERGKRK